MISKKRLLRIILDLDNCMEMQWGVINNLNARVLALERKQCACKIKVNKAAKKTEKVDVVVKPKKKAGRPRMYSDKQRIERRRAYQRKYYLAHKKKA